jgi:hypothetical protein
VQRSILATVVVGGVLALSACGGTETPEDTIEPAAETSAEEAAASEPAEAEPAESAHAADIVELSEQMLAAQQGISTVRMETTMSGEALEDAGTGEMTQTADVIFADSLEDMRMSMTMDMMGNSIEMILVDSVMYMGMGELTGGGFVSIDLGDAANEPQLASALALTENADPAGQLGAVSDAVQTFEHTGTEQVDGQEVDVYEVSVDPAKVSDPVAISVDEESLAAMGDTPIEFVYRVDEQGLPVSIDMVMEADGQEVVATTAYSDWGADLTIEAPPADQITADEATG